MNEMAPPDQFDKTRPVRSEGTNTALASLVAVLATIIGLILLAWTVLFVTKGRFLKSTFEKYASRSAERQVRVAGDFQFYFNVIDIKFLAEGLTITNPEWAREPYFLKSRLIDSEIETIPLIFGNRRADWLTLLGGDINLEWSKDGKRNTWTMGRQTGKPFEMPEIRTALIDGTRVRYTDPRLLLTADVRVDTVRASDNRVGGDVSFSGTGTLRQKPFTMDGKIFSPNEAIANESNRLLLNARSAGTVLRVTGTLPGATRIEGAKLQLAIRGPDMAEAFDFLGVAVPHSRAWRMTSALTKVTPEWRLTGIRGVIGQSDFSGRATFAMIEPRLKIDADLNTRSLHFIDAAGWFGFDPKAVAARGGEVTTVAGGAPRILPDAPLRTESLSRFDADLRYTISGLKGVSWPLTNIGMHLTLDNRLLKLNPLTMDMARGHLTSEIAIDARRQPVRTSYDIRLSPTPMGRLLAGFGVEEAGTTGTVKARIQLTGLGDTVHKSLASSSGRIAIIVPQGNLWTRNAQLSELDIGTFVWKMWQKKLKEPVEINCGLIAFTVRDGIAAADPILFDTRKNVVLGRGGFSFRNEALDLRFRADGKKFSLFSAQSPVGIGGYFAAPKLDVISPQLIGRGAAGLGLAVVATPLAGILAFVDVGDAKSAACGPVLSGATAAAQRTTGGKPRDDVGRGTTAKSESGKQSSEGRKEQRKKFLGLF
jgi:AsmA family protein